MSARRSRTAASSGTSSAHGAVPAMMMAMVLFARLTSAFQHVGSSHRIAGVRSPLQHMLPPVSDGVAFDGSHHHHHNYRTTSRQRKLTTQLSEQKDRKSIMEDPNPGGRNNFGGSDDGDNSQDAGGLNIIDQFRGWLGSEEGKRDIQTYTISLAIALLLRTLIIEPRYIPSLSMYPTFDIGDQLAVEKVSKRIRPMERKEVVVFNPPATFRDIMDVNYGVNSKKSKEALIKRIVAVEGDTVQVTGGKLYINGEKQDEPFTAEDAAYEFGPVQVPRGDVLVLGDNRNHSLDGHIWGFLPTENVIGRAVFVYWPPWRIGTENLY